MRFSRSFRSGLAGLLALLVLIAIWIIVVVEKCERHVSDDETAGIATQQIPFKGERK